MRRRRPWRGDQPEERPRPAAPADAQSMRLPRFVIGIVLVDRLPRKIGTPARRRNRLASRRLQAPARSAKTGAAAMRVGRICAASARRASWPERLKRSLRSSGSFCRRRPAPVANYVAFVRTGNLLVVSGQLCLDARRQARRQGQARRRRIGRGRPKSGARLRDQPAGAGQGRARRSRQGRAGGAARRLHQFRRRPFSTGRR